MITTIGLVSILAGSVLAYTADRIPAHTKLLESAGGFFLIAGLALLGSRLPYIPH